MIDRRNFNIGAMGLALGIDLLPGTAAAQPKRIMKVGNASGVNDAQQCFMTCGQHPRLGYYAAEGVDIEFVNMSNVSQSMQTVITGETNFATVVPMLFLLQAAKEPNMGVVAPYAWLARNATVLVVKPDSPYKSIADLKGKRFGIRNQGDFGTTAVKLMFKELGIDDPATTFIPVGDGGPAGTALHQGRVDAIISFDTAAARVELAGFPLRYLPLTDKFANLGGAWYGVSQKDLKENRKAYVGLFRGIAKSTLFARANLDQAINIHWALYPESKPKSKSEEEGRQEFKTILGQRKDNWLRPDADPEKRIGYISPSAMRNSVVLATEISKDPQLESKIGDANRLFTNELIDEVNAFDKAAILKQAKEFALAK